MGRRTVLEVCKVCGAQARKINYFSRSKGNTYRYSKYVHANGTTHYFRLMQDPKAVNTASEYVRTSIFESIEEILDVKMKGKEMRIGEIRLLLENSTGKSVGTATLYRNINKLLKLDLISKRIDNGIVLYGRKSENPLIQNMKTTKMSIGIDFSHSRTFVTVFAHIVNMGIRMITEFPISLPVGVIDSLDQINLNAFDETKRITLNKKSIAYSYTDQTGIMLTLNRPLRKSEEENLFLDYTCEIEGRPVKLLIPSDVDFFKVNCEVPRGGNVEIKKRLVDGLREIEPMLLRRTATDLGQTIIEAEFEKALRGEAIVISLK